MKHFLETVLFELRRTRRLGERALAQLTADQLAWRPDDEANSIAIIVKHLHGNMLSRWTGFLTSDGEKPWRERDAEFDPPDRDVGTLWREGWDCCLGAIEALTPDDLGKTITIRGEPLTVVEALQRQVSHYAHHVGQIVFLARQLRGKGFESLTIPRGKSAEFDRGDYKTE